MPFQILNSPDAAANPASYAPQAREDKVDTDILVAALGATPSGWSSGCAVTAQGTPNMTVAVAAGTVLVAGASVTVNAVAALTVTAADAKLDRTDLVVVNAAGTVSMANGTAAKIPCLPSIPASSMVLASVHVPANATSVTGGQILDKRVPCVAALPPNGAAGGSLTGTYPNPTVIRPVNTQTANYVLVITDAGKAVEYNSASAGTVTVPPNSSVAFPVGTIIEVPQLGAGALTLVAGAGVTLDGNLTGLVQNGSFLLRKRATDEWQVTAVAPSATYAAGGLPATAVAAGAKNRYDPARNIYNVSGADLHRFRAALAAAQAGTAFCHVVCVGDSTTAGVGANSPGGGVDRSQLSYPAVLRQTLAFLGIPPSGTGWVPAGSTIPDTRWFLTGGWAAASVHGFCAQASVSGSAATFTSDVSGTIVDLIYLNNSGGAFTVAIDGETPVTVTPAAGATYAHYTVSGLPNAAHTVVVTTSTNTLTAILAIEVRQATGVSVSNFGESGMTSTDWATRTTFADLTSALLAVPADLYIVDDGINDENTAISVPTFTANMTTFLGLLTPTTDAALIVPNPIFSSLAAYAQAIYVLADTLNLPLVDMLDRWGSWASANGLGMMFDSFHPSATGYVDMAQAVAGLLAPPSGALKQANPVVQTIKGTATGAITFSNIPQGGNTLRLRFIGRSLAAAEADILHVLLNGDSGANYDIQQFNIYGGTNLDPANQAATTAWHSAFGVSDLPAASATAGVPGILELTIPLYAGTDFHKMGIWSGGYSDPVAAAGDGVLAQLICTWRNTAAITSLTVGSTNANLAPGTTAMLWIE